VVVSAHQAALEDAEEVFRGVAVNATGFANFMLA
jgi:hypothetical protein